MRQMVLNAKVVVLIVGSANYSHAATMPPTSWVGVFLYARTGHGRGNNRVFGGNVGRRGRDGGIGLRHGVESGQVL
jgi:hypothetical protein